MDYHILSKKIIKTVAPGVSPAWQARSRAFPNHSRAFPLNFEGNAPGTYIYANNNTNNNDYYH